MMKTGEIQFRGKTIEVYKYGNRTYYYPSFNGNAEFTDYRKCCSYIRTVLYHDRLCEDITGISLLAAKSMFPNLFTC